jgi:hypothetical protein
MASDQLYLKRIGEEFKCIGEWWLPRLPDPVNPGSKHCGTLTFIPGKGIKLDIIGGLDLSELQKDLFSDTPVDMIWGLSTKGELITLSKCRRVGMTIGTTWTESYLVHEVFVSKNAWFKPDERITFTSLTLQYTHLAEWVGISGFQVPSFEQHNEFIKNKRAEVIYKLPNDLQSFKMKDYAMSIGFGYSLPGIAPATQKATIEQHTTVRIKPRNSKEIAIEDARVLMRVIQNFLSLLMYEEPIYPLIIEGEVRIEGKTPEEKSRGAVRLLYEPINTKKSSDNINRHDVLFLYKDVADLWEDALNKMITIEDGELKPMFNDFFAEYFTPPKFVEDRFVAILRTIEDFHRRTSKKNDYMEKEEYYEKLLRKFSSVIDEARRTNNIGDAFESSLRKKLSTAYRYSLETRLDDLLSVYHNDFTIIFAGIDKKEFIREIAATYEWLTHFDDGDKKAIKDGDKLAYLNLKLQLFMIALLFHYIGIPSEKIEAALMNNKFDYLRRSKSGA